MGGIEEVSNEEIAQQIIVVEAIESVMKVDDRLSLKAKIIMALDQKDAQLAELRAELSHQNDALAVEIVNNERLRAQNTLYREALEKITKFPGYVTTDGSSPLGVALDALASSGEGGKETCQGWLQLYLWGNAWSIPMLLRI